MSALLLATIVAMQAVPPNSDTEYVRLLYKSNKDSFQFGKFRFAYRRGSCASAAEAEAGVFSRFAEMEGFYAFDGTNARYEKVAKAVDLAAATKKISANKTSSILASFRMLTNGKVTFMDSLTADEITRAIRHKATISKDPVAFDRKLEFPLYLGNKAPHAYDLFHALTEVKEGRASLDQFEIDSLLGERKVNKLTIDYKNAKVTYWIDLERGGIPLRIVQEPAGQGTKSLIVQERLQFVASAGWIPMRRLEVIGEKTFHEYVLTEIDIERKLDATVFRLDFSDPIGLVDQARQLRYSPRSSWSLLDLPGPSSNGTKTVDLRPAFAADDLPGESAPSTSWPIIAAAILGVLCLLSCAVAVYRTCRATA
jgi:hypothetical protein